MHLNMLRIDAILRQCAKAQRFAGPREKIDNMHKTCRKLFQLNLAPKYFACLGSKVGLLLGLSIVFAVLLAEALLFRSCAITKFVRQLLLSKKSGWFRDLCLVL